MSVAIAALLLGLGLWLLRRAWRRDGRPSGPPLCPACGYEVTPELSRCPECGRGLWDRSALARAGPGVRRRRLLGAALVISAGLLTPLLPSLGRTALLRAPDGVLVEAALSGRDSELMREVRDRAVKGPLAPRAARRLAAAAGSEAGVLDAAALSTLLSNSPAARGAFAASALARQADAAAQWDPAFGDLFEEMAALGLVPPADSDAWFRAAWRPRLSVPTLGPCPAGSLVPVVAQGKLRLGRRSILLASLAHPSQHGGGPVIVGSDSSAVVVGHLATPVKVDGLSVTLAVTVRVASGGRWVFETRPIELDNLSVSADPTLAGPPNNQFSSLASLLRKGLHVAPAAEGRPALESIRMHRDQREEAGLVECGLKLSPDAGAPKPPTPEKHHLLVEVAVHREGGTLTAGRLAIEVARPGGLKTELYNGPLAALPGWRSCLSAAAEWDIAAGLLRPSELSPGSYPQTPELTLRAGDIVELRIVWACFAEGWLKAATPYEPLRLRVESEAARQDWAKD